MDSPAAVFSLMEAAIKAQGSELVNKVKGVILYDIGGKHWTVDLKNGTGAVNTGKAGTPDITITVSEDDFLQLAAGKLNPQQAFMRGKLKLKGNMAIAMKLNAVLDAARKMAVPGAVPAAAGSGAASAPAKVASATTPSIKSQPLFDAIGLAIKSDGENLVKKVNGTILFHITTGGSAPAASFLLDLKKSPGNMTANPTSTTPAPELTITVADDDFVAMSDGKLSAQQAFMKGKLKVKGNMALAMKLQTVLEAARKMPAAKL